MLVSGAARGKHRVHPRHSGTVGHKQSRGRWDPTYGGSICSEPIHQGNCLEEDADEDAISPRDWKAPPPFARSSLAVCASDRLMSRNLPPTSELHRPFIKLCIYFFCGMWFLLLLTQWHWARSNSLPQATHSRMPIRLSDERVLSVDPLASGSRKCFSTGSWVHAFLSGLFLGWTAFPFSNGCSPLFNFWLVAPLAPVSGGK